MKPKTVDEYIANAPEETQEKLWEIRKIIKSVAPKAEEKLSYAMPYYGYKGRLVYFAYAKKHVGLYVMPPTVEEFKNELKDYVTSTATVQFPLNKKLPVNLIKRLIKFGVERNEKRKTS